MWRRAEIERRGVKHEDVVGSMFTFYILIPTYRHLMLQDNPSSQPQPAYPRPRSVRIGLSLLQAYSLHCLQHQSNISTYHSLHKSDLLTSVYLDTRAATTWPAQSSYY